MPVASEDRFACGISTETAIPIGSKLMVENGGEKRICFNEAKAKFILLVWGVVTLLLWFVAPL